MMDELIQASSSDARFCTNCGGTAISDWSYCPSCGAGLGAVRQKVSARTWTDLALGVAVVAALMLPRLQKAPPPCTEMAAAAPVMAQQSQVRVEVQTPATQWVDTGIDVAPGGTLSIQATGTWNPWSGTMPNMGPDGHARRGNYDVICRDASWGALVGRIDNGPAFAIGSSADIQPTGTGRLYVGINDDYNSGATSDNTGSLDVTIQGDGTVSSQAQMIPIPKGPREARR